VNLNFHEDLRRATHTRTSSDRNFGLVFAGGCALLGLAPLVRHGSIKWPLFVVAGAFFAAAIIYPRVLGPLNFVWTKLGLLLGRIVNPVMTALMFFLVFTPAGLIGRMLGKDPLRLKKTPEAKSYWIVRDPPGPEPATMAKQF